MVKEDTTQTAVLLGQKLKHVFVATADSRGLPHVAAAGPLNLENDGLVTVTAWFCPGTVMNLEVNPKVSIVMWDPKADSGYQILGDVEKMEETAMMDGFVPGLENKAPSPQVERTLHVRADKVLAFTHAPHSDLEG